MQRWIPWLLALAATLGGLGRGAAAQDRSWLVLPSTDGETPGRAGEVAEVLERTLREAEAEVLPADEARVRFEARESMEPVAADESDLDVVAREAQEALMHVATGHHELARRSVSTVLERAESALESLNRETTSARNVLDSCLYMIRSLLDSGDVESARARVLSCRRLVPDIEPDPYDHPPSVIRLLREAEEELRNAPHGSLRVESAPTGCAVYLNGRHLGVTPFVMERLPPGEYRVQVECEDAGSGRVHRVVLAAEPTEVRVDTAFDAALISRERLSLRYPNGETHERRRLGDGGHIGFVVGATDVVLVTPLPGNALRLDRVAVRGPEVLASVRVPLSGERHGERAALREAARALVEGRSVDLATGAAMEPWTPPPGATVAVAAPAVAAAVAPSEPGPVEASSSDGPPLAGWIVGGAGAAGLVAGWAFYAQLETRRDELAVAQPEDPDFLDRQGRLDDARLPVLLAGGAGGVALTVAMPLLLPPDRGIPWWAWAAGGAGLAVAGAATLHLASEGECIDRDCTRSEEPAVLSGLLFAHAAPLLAVPLTYAVRGLGADAEVSAQVSADRVHVTLSGAL